MDSVSVSPRHAEAGRRESAGAELQRPLPSPPISPRRMHGVRVAASETQDDAQPQRRAVRTGENSEEDIGTFPFVTVIVPVRNEAGFIEGCVQSILNSRYPAGSLEVIVADGLSDDGTREIIQRLMASDARLRLIDNPRQIVPCAMNLAIAAARGEVIIRVDGHADVADDFVASSVAELRQRPECWCAGGAIESVNSTRLGRIIATAMSTPVGVGNAHFRLGRSDGYVDTVAFGAYWRWVFDRIGMFDEELIRNQDDELNARLIQRGGKIFLSRAIRSRYYPRTNLRRLWRQYYQYGFWRIRTIQKLGRPATIRQLLPVTFVGGIFSLAIASLFWTPAAGILAAGLLGYSLLLLAGAISVARREGLAGFLLAPLVFLILHLGYGLGGLQGILWFVLLRRRCHHQEMSR